MLLYIQHVLTPTYVTIYGKSLSSVTYIHNKNPQSVVECLRLHWNITDW